MGGQLCWKDHLVFRCNSVCTNVCMYVCMHMYWYKISSTSKGKPSLSNENAMTDFHQTWYVGSGAQLLTTWSVVTECAYLIPHLHICSDWLIINKSNIQSSVWATLMKLSMWVVMGISATHVVCRHQTRIFNTSFAYIFWLADNKKSQISRVLYALRYSCSQNNKRHLLTKLAIFSCIFLYFWTNIVFFG